MTVVLIIMLGSLLALVLAGCLFWLRRWLIAGGAAESEGLSRGLAAGAFASAAAGLFGLLVTMLFGPVLLGVVAVVLAMRYYVYSRAAARRHLLTALAVAAERGMPLPWMLRATAADAGPATRRRLCRLAEVLEAGFSLPQALRLQPVSLPPKTRTLIEVGFAAGDPAAALRTAAEDPLGHQSVADGVVLRLLYVTLLLAGFAWITFYICLEIIPGLFMFVTDFDVSVPPLVQALTAATPLLSLLAGPLMLALLIAFVVAAAAYLFPVRPPGTEFFFRRLDAADVLAVLAMAVRRQMPIADALSVLASAWPFPRGRFRLTQAQDDVRRGAAWEEALARRGLIGETELALIRAAERAGNLPFCLETLAEGSRRRHYYWWSGVVQLGFLPVLGLVGLLVALVALTLFLSLLELIGTLL